MREGREHTLLGPTTAHRPLLFHRIRSPHIFKAQWEREGRGHYTLVQTREVRHRAGEGLAQVGEAPRSQAPHSWLVRESGSIITRILMVDNSPFTICHLGCIPPNWFYIIFLQFLERSLLPIKCMWSRELQNPFSLTAYSEIETPELVQSSRKSLEHYHSTLSSHLKLWSNPRLQLKCWNTKWKWWSFITSLKVSLHLIPLKCPRSHCWSQQINSNGKSGGD